MIVNESPAEVSQCFPLTQSVWTVMTSFTSSIKLPQNSQHTAFQEFKSLFMCSELDFISLRSQTLLCMLRVI